MISLSTADSRAPSTAGRRPEITHSSPTWVTRNARLRQAFSAVSSSVSSTNAAHARNRAANVSGSRPWATVTQYTATCANAARRSSVAAVTRRTTVMWAALIRPAPNDSANIGYDTNQSASATRSRAGRGDIKCDSASHRGAEANPSPAHTCPAVAAASTWACTPDIRFDRVWTCRATINDCTPDTDPDTSANTSIAADTPANAST